MRVINSESELREALRDYVGSGWTALNHNVVGLSYLTRIDKADLDELIEIADELGLI